MKKRIISIMMALVLAAGLVACGDSSSDDQSTAPVDESTEELLQYNISACLTKNNEYNQILLNGFSDALYDYLGEENISIKIFSASEEESTDDIAATAVKSSPDLIFTTGKQMLRSMTAATSELPIVATGVVNFQDTLRIANIGSSSWDRTTGMNVTGISSKPSIVDQVSLMIEATEDLQAVGLLFMAEDTDSIYQNEIFEKYLDQAGIPWKEYIIPAENNSDDGSESADESTGSDTTNGFEGADLGESKGSSNTDESESATDNEDSDASQSSEALSAIKFVASSAKEGMDHSTASLEDNNLVGINSPSSTRVATVSDFWTGGKDALKVPAEEDNDEDTLEEDNPDEDSLKEDGLDENDFDNEASAINYKEPTFEERIQEVCNECSVIYVPYGSMLTDKMDIISSIATDAGVATVAGDTTLGESALVTLFTDPYDLGYSAGKKAVRVLNGDDISTIKIGYGDTDDVVKLYNASIAEALNIEFPKSFSEINEFLLSYEYGSKTARHVSEETEEN